MIQKHEVQNEARRQIAQAAIDATKSEAERNRFGQFATPNALAIDIAQYVRSVIDDHERVIRFADPSIGTGSFYSAALSVFGSKHIKSAIGIELDSAFCDTARNLWAEDGLEVLQGDFTRIVATASCMPAPNLILANPPYVRHHHLGRENKVRLQRLAHTMTGVEVSGLAGLYVYFVLLATAWMDENGYAAWLIPSEFMDVNYGNALKRFLISGVTLIRIHRFDPDDVQFGDALVSSVVMVLRKASPPNGHAVEFTFGGTMNEPHAREDISLQTLSKSRKWTIHPKHRKNDRRVCSNEDGAKLANFFRVRRGIATGRNKFFILDHADAKRRGFPSEYLRPILPNPRHLHTTAIEGDEDGYPRIDRGLCVIDCDLPEHLVEQRHPALWEYLQTAEALGIKGGYLVGKRSPWYRQEQRDPAPFLCTYMGRGSDDKPPFRFILNRSRAIATNLYLMLYPHRGLATMLRRHPGRVLDVYELLRAISAHELRGEGRVYGGGLHKIEPSELSRISASDFVERWPELEESVTHVETLSLFPM